MNKFHPIKRKESDLLEQYFSGQIDAEKFAELIFESNDADRVRRRIEEKYNKINNQKHFKELQRI